MVVTPLPIVAISPSHSISFRNEDEPDEQDDKPHISWFLIKTTIKENIWSHKIDLWSVLAFLMITFPSLENDDGDLDLRKNYKRLTLPRLVRRSSLPVGRLRIGRNLFHQTDDFSVGWCAGDVRFVLGGSRKLSCLSGISLVVLSRWEEVEIEIWVENSLEIFESSQM